METESAPAADDAWGRGGGGRVSTFGCPLLSICGTTQHNTFCMNVCTILLVCCFFLNGHSHLLLIQFNSVQSNPIQSNSNNSILKICWSHPQGINFSQFIQTAVRSTRHILFQWCIAGAAARTTFHFAVDSRFSSPGARNKPRRPRDPDGKLRTFPMRCIHSITPRVCLTSGRHPQGAERVQEPGDGGPRGQQTFHQVRASAQ